MTTKLPADPPLGPTGRLIFDDVISRFELEPAEHALLVNICRTADLCDELAALIAKTGLVDARGAIAAPVVELRSQRLTLGRLQSMLRLPEEADAERPQRRAGFRGPYAVGGGL